MFIVANVNHKTRLTNEYIWQVNHGKWQVDVGVNQRSSPDKTMANPSVKHGTSLDFYC